MMIHMRDSSRIINYQVKENINGKQEIHMLGFSKRIRFKKDSLYTQRERQSKLRVFKSNNFIIIIRIMVDVWLVILTVIFSIICVGVSLFIFLLFTDRSEEGTVLVWIGRAIVVFNILMVVSFLATIPLDISNS